MAALPEITKPFKRSNARTCTRYPYVCRIVWQTRLNCAQNVAQMALYLYGTDTRIATHRAYCFGQFKAPYGSNSPMPPLPVRPDFLGIKLTWPKCTLPEGKSRTSEIYNPSMFCPSYFVHFHLHCRLASPKYCLIEQPCILLGLTCFGHISTKICTPPGVSLVAHAERTPLRLSYVSKQPIDMRCATGVIRGKYGGCTQIEHGGTTQCCITGNAAAQRRVGVPGLAFRDRVNSGPPQFRHV